MDDSAVTLIGFLRDAPQISGSALIKRILEQSNVGFLANASNLDISALLAAIAELEEHQLFKTETFMRFEQDEMLIRQSVESQTRDVERLGFPAWKIGDRCTPLAFALLQGLVNPEITEHIRLHGRLASLDKFIGKHANTLRGVALFAMQLVAPFLADSRIAGLPEFTHLLREYPRRYK